MAIDSETWCRRTLLLTLIAGLGACSTQDSVDLSIRTNELLEKYLKGQRINVAPLKAGDAIKLPDLVSVGSSNDGECLSISFLRSHLSDQFVHDLFYPKKGAMPPDLPPFTEAGVEAILTSDRVVLNLYSGVVLHLQPSITYPSGYSAFKLESVTGDVVKVIGEAAHVTAGAIPESLRGFVYLRDGRAFVYQSSESERGKGRDQDSKLADSMAKLSLSFKPTVIDQVIDAKAVACTVKPFR
jgi:hypothetical protein